MTEPRRNRLETPPPPTFGQVLAHGLMTGLVGAVIVSLIVTTIVAIVAVLYAEIPNFRSTAVAGGWAALMGYVPAFLFGTWRLLPRTVQDSSFRVGGFLATFFGLAILVIFFWGLIANVVNWFHYTPILVALKNEETLKSREALKQVEALRAAKKAELDRDYKLELAAAEDDMAKKAATEAAFGSPDKVKELEKQEEAELAKAKTLEQRAQIRDKYTMEIRAVGGVYAENLRVLDTAMAQNKFIADLPLRDTSAWAALWHFLFETPSNEPEAVGIKPALFGSLWLALITITFAVPIGTGAALYLEEYKQSGRLGYWIQVNINNLAGVPSIVFGILGAFVFVELIFKPFHRVHEDISVRNLLGGGLTLGLLTMPVIIVSAQEAIRAVPQSIRQGAYALGATQWQVIWHQVLPLARPGIMTGTILAVSRAIGEAAPLVLFGATTFIAYTPNPFSDFSALPIQIYNWAERPTNPVVDGQVVEAWTYNMALASMVLLVMLLALNAVAIYLRNQSQKKVRW